MIRQSRGTTAGGDSEREIKDDEGTLARASVGEREKERKREDRADSE
jgi:hypothetical protein